MTDTGIPTTKNTLSPDFLPSKEDIQDTSAK